MLKYCSIGSGSSGNCHFVSYKDTNILIDAGLSGKRIITGLEEINADINKIYVMPVEIDLELIPQDSLTKMFKANEGKIS